MSAFIIQRGSSGGDELITGIIALGGTGGVTSVTIPDLIGKTRFELDCANNYVETVDCVTIIRYIDGQIYHVYKASASLVQQSASAGSAKSAAYFDPETGTIDVSEFTGKFYGDSYAYTVFG